MAKIKKMKMLNKAVSAELKPFGISKAVCTDTYAYFADEGSVCFKLTEGTTEDKWFCEFIEERFDYTIENAFILSLLHEVGHHLANDEIDGAIYEFCTAEKDRISAEMATAKTADEQKILEWQYFNLPDEIMATQWAVNYAKANPKAIKKMWKRIKKALFKFYDANGVLS